MTESKYWVLIPAAGLGKRMESETPKQYLTVAGRSILAWTLSKVGQLDNIEQVIVVLQSDDPFWQSTKLSDHTKISTVVGGDERFKSVMNGLTAFKSEISHNDWVLVHDAVRPCISVQDINKLMTELVDDPVGGLLASQVKDTLKHSSNEENIVASTLDREEYWLAATPQMFRYGLLYEAMEFAIENKLEITDEAAAMEAMGHKVRLIEGRSDNLKVTHPEDLPLVEFLLNQENHDAI